MRILVGNNTFSSPGGSETYNYALIEELVSLGHSVEAVARFGPGIVSEKINELGVPVYFEPVRNQYDLILLSHSSSIEMTKKARGFKVQTCHGIYPKLEQPVFGLDRYISISEEVQMHLAIKGFVSSIIRNGVDCNRFNSNKPINSKLTNVLSLAQHEEANRIIRGACDLIGCNLITCNKFTNWRWDIETLISEADLVITLGRGAYESMASGRNVLVFDCRDYQKTSYLGDGVITTDNVYDLIKNNCSGRFSKRQFTSESLANEMMLYSKDNGDKLRQFALGNLNIKDVAQQYIDLIK